MTQNVFYTRLKNRGQITVSGSDRRTFLQGLISNDINLLDTQSLIYACFLTPQGKFLYDFFIREEARSLVLDCEGGERAESFFRVLQMYKLHANVEISMVTEIEVFACFGFEHGFPDPRHEEIGRRFYGIPPQGIEEKPFDVWDCLRIALCVPDGSRDMVPQKSTLLECGIDRLNGVSFGKGCYMGQELTARMHYRGLVKKHLRCVSPQDIGYEQFPPSGTEIVRDGHIIGEMRSFCGNIGIALLKDESCGE